MTDPITQATPAVGDDPPRRAREQQGAHTRRLILESAGEVFAARGFDGATMREIGERAGVKQPLIVYHFESKDGLWKAAVDWLWEELVERVRRRWAEAESSAEGGEAVVRAVLRAFVRVVADRPAWLHILLREAAAPGPRLDWLVESHSRGTYEAGAGFLKAAQEQGLLPDVPTRHLLYILVGGLTFALSIASEVEIVTGEDVASDAFLDRHVDTLMALISHSTHSTHTIRDAS
jgi:AcrR family transcriptional regulator